LKPDAPLALDWRGPAEQKYPRKRRVGHSAAGANFVDTASSDNAEVQGAREALAILIRMNVTFRVGGKWWVPCLLVVERQRCVVLQ